MGNYLGFKLDEINKRFSLLQLKAHSVTTWRHPGEHGGELSVFCWWDAAPGRSRTPTNLHANVGNPASDQWHSSLPSLCSSERWFRGSLWIFFLKFRRESAFGWQNEIEKGRKRERDKENKKGIQLKKHGTLDRIIEKNGNEKCKYQFRISKY